MIHSSARAPDACVHISNHIGFFGHYGVGQSAARNSHHDARWQVNEPEQVIMFEISWFTFSQSLLHDPICALNSRFAPSTFAVVPSQKIGGIRDLRQGNSFANRANLLTAPIRFPAAIAASQDASLPRFDSAVTSPSRELS